MTDALTQLREARKIDRLEAENDKLREEVRRLRMGLLEAVMTFNRSDPFYTVFMEKWGDLLPIRMQGGPDHAA